MTKDLMFLFQTRRNREKIPIKKKRKKPYTHYKKRGMKLRKNI